MNRPRLGKGDSIFAATEKTSPAAKPVAEPSDVISISREQDDRHPAA